jgi:hypothetical protein
MLDCRMPRARLAAQLEIVETQIELTQASIDGQRALIENMRQKAYAIGDAETHLTILQARLAMHQAERNRLRTELAALLDQDPR